MCRIRVILPVSIELSSFFLSYLIVCLVDTLDLEFVMCPTPKSFQKHFQVHPLAPLTTITAMALVMIVMTVRCTPNGFSLPSLITNYRSNLQSSDIDYGVSRSEFGGREDRKDKESLSYEAGVSQPGMLPNYMTNACFHYSNTCHPGHYYYETRVMPDVLFRVQIYWYEVNVTSCPQTST